LVLPFLFSLLLFKEQKLYNADYFIINFVVIKYWHCAVVIS